MDVSENDSTEAKVALNPVQGTFYLILIMALNAAFVHFSYNFLCEKFSLPHTTVWESLLLYLLIKTFLRGFFTLQ